MSLQYLRKNVENEVDFLRADKQESFQQVDTINTIILGVWLGMPKLSKITSLLFLCNILRKK